MITVFLISFREFLEAFLFVGVFLGISRRLGLKKELEISFAAGSGMVLSLLLAVATFSFSKYLLIIFSEKNGEILESLILIFSSLFITYTILSIHDILHKAQIKIVDKARQKLHDNVFDISLFFTIMLLVIREGFEIALFTASTSFFSIFFQNFIGLIAGFVSASVFGMLIFFTYLKLPTQKIFRITEYALIFLGASMMGKGITKLFDIKNNLDLIRLIITVIYIAIIYLMFLRKKQKRGRF